jgi:hypothetical protein
MEKMPKLVTAINAYLNESDVGIVLTISLLMYMLRVGLWQRFHLWPTAINWTPFALSLVLTPLMSTTAEVQWGGPFFWRAVFFNGGMSLLVWHVFLPRAKRYWPDAFRDLPMNNGPANHTPH